MKLEAQYRLHAVRDTAAPEQIAAFEQKASSAIDGQVAKMLKVAEKALRASLKEQIAECVGDLKGGKSSIASCNRFMKMELDTNAYQVRGRGVLELILLPGNI